MRAAAELPPPQGCTMSPTEVDYPSLRARLLQEARAQLPDGEVLRVYWYDVPAPGGKTDEHHAIDALDDVKLRLGPHPTAGQPAGLGGLITVELMGLAQQRAITHALVASQDTAVAPGVQAAQAMGVRVDGLCLGPATAAYAALSADWDTKRSWSLNDLRALLADRTNENADESSDTDPALPPSLLAWAPGHTLTSALSSFASLPALPDRPPRSPGFPLPPPHSTALNDMTLAGMAQAAYAHLRGGPLAVVFAALKPGIRALPREIDAALLAVGRQTLGRALAEPEKRALRREFQDLVRRTFEDSLNPSAGQSLIGA